MPSIPSRARPTRAPRWRREILAYGIAALLAAAVILVTSLTGEEEATHEPTPPASTTVESPAGVQP